MLVEDDQTATRPCNRAGASGFMVNERQFSKDALGEDSFEDLPGKHDIHLPFFHHEHFVTGLTEFKDYGSSIVAPDLGTVSEGLGKFHKKNQSFPCSTLETKHPFLTKSSQGRHETNFP